MEVRPGYKQTGVGVIPVDWEVQALEDSTDPLRPISYGIVQTGSNLTNGVACLRVVDINDGRINKTELIHTSKQISDAYRRTVLKTGDLVMPLRGKVGDVGAVDKELEGANLTRGVALLAIRPNLSSDYCRHFISWSATRRRLEQSMNGSALQEVPIATLRSFQLALPRTEPEQRAIATALGDVDALLGGLDRLIAKKRDVKQAAMQQLLTGKTRLPDFNQEWNLAEFGDVATIRNAKVIAAFTPPGTQCIELESISQGSGRLLGSVEAKGSSLKYTFKKGDVLFGRLRAYLRKYWLASFDGVCSTEIWPLIPYGERVSRDYLHQLVQTREFVDAAGVSYGTHMPRSDWSVLRKLAVALPTIPEQTAVAAVLSDMDAELASLETRRDKTHALKQAMMQELLTGKTRLI